MEVVGYNYSNKIYHISIELISQRRTRLNTCLHMGASINSKCVDQGWFIFYSKWHDLEATKAKYY